MSTSDITIKLILDVEGCSHLQEIQRHVWIGEPDEIIPNHVLVTMAKNGGPVFGAYAPDGPVETGGMVGFLLGWLATEPGPGKLKLSETPKLKYCSHIAGVLKEWQGQGIGTKLKLVQRQFILDQGLTDHITWTYDPMYPANSVLNIHRLGAICTTYLCNVYGEMQDVLNEGLPSDRCQVDWFLNSQRVLHAISENRQDPPWDIKCLDILAAQTRADGFLQPASLDLNFAGQPIAMPLPLDVPAMRQKDHGLLYEWRLIIRTILEESFAAGYALVDCVELPGRGWYYILVSLEALAEQEASWP